MSSKPALKVVQDAEEAVPTEILATSIRAIAEGVRRLRSGSLTDRALFLLIQDASPNVGARKYRPPSIKEIRAVFDGIDSLDRTFLRKKPA